VPLRIRVEDDGRRIPGEWRPSRRHLVEYGTEAEQIRPGVELFTARLLRRHEGHSADRCPGNREMFLRDGGGRQGGRGGPLPLRFRQTEIENFCLAALRDEDVRRLDVAMNDLLLMRRVERVGNLNRQFEQVWHREGLAGNPVLQRAPFEQLHRDEPRLVVLADVVNRADIRMVQRGRCARFALKALQCLRVTGCRGRQKLQGDLASQPSVLGGIYDAHASLAEFGNDPVVRNERPYHTSTKCWRGCEAVSIGR
jgi:hypothetical protein